MGGSAARNKRGDGRSGGLNDSSERKRLDRGVSRKQRSLATQQRAEVNKLELQSQLGQTWENLLLEYLEDAMRAPSLAPSLMANPFVRTAGQLLFSRSLAGVSLEPLTSYDKLRMGDAGICVYQMLVQNFAAYNSGLSLGKRKDTTCFLRWIMSVMSDNTVQTCHQRAIGSITKERRVATVILNVYQSTGIAKGDGSRQSLENHEKLDEIRRFSNKNFVEDHDMHRNLALTED